MHVSDTSIYIDAQKLTASTALGSWADEMEDVPVPCKPSLLLLPPDFNTYSFSEAGGRSSGYNDRSNSSWGGGQSGW